jgi:peptide/nickel transport system substrate-binding protein
MHVRPTTHRRRVGRYGAAALVAFSLVAAACGDKKDDDAVVVDDTEADTEDTTPDDGGTDDTADVTTPEDDATPEPTAPVVTEAPESAFEPVFGGRLVVAGEAEVANPWIPAAMQCDSFCHMRARTFYDPLAVFDDQLELQPFLAESITPNEDFTEFTIKVREGITFHDGTPLDGAAVMDNLSRNFTGFLLAASTKDIARVDGDLMLEVVDDFTFKMFTGLNGDPAQPIPWPLFPTYLTQLGGLIASPTWLAAVDAGTADPSAAVGTGPFTLTSYAPGDSLVVTRNPNYWISDENGDLLPYLDEIEFRVIPDAQVRAQALESGDVDMMSTSDAAVISDFDGDDAFSFVLQSQYGETNFALLNLRNPALADKSVRCALLQAIDKDDWNDVIYNGYLEIANGPFSPGQEGYLADNGSLPYDPDAAAAAIAAYEEANGPVAINYSTTPSATNLTAQQFVTDAWSSIGVDVTIDSVEQSKLINDALGAADTFVIFQWRLHAGLYVDQQNYWWQSLSIPLNFGGIVDPEIDALLQQARSELDPAVRRGYAEEINRRFASECYIIPYAYTKWGIISDPVVQNVGRSPMPDNSGFLLDGAGFPGQVWLTAAFRAE